MWTNINIEERMETSSPAAIVEIRAGQMKIFYDITEKCLRDISENISRLLFTLCLIYFSSTFT